MRRKIGTGSDLGVFSLTGMVELDTDDYIEVWVANATSNANVTAQYINLTIK